MFRSFQIIFRELVGSLLKSLNLKFLKLWRLFVVMWQHNVWRVCVVLCVERYVGLQSAWCCVWRGMLDCSLHGALCGEVCWTAVCMVLCVERYVGLQSNIPFHTEHHANAIPRCRRRSRCCMRPRPGVSWWIWRRC